MGQISSTYEYMPAPSPPSPRQFIETRLEQGPLTEEASQANVSKVRIVILVVPSFWFKLQNPLLEWCEHGDDLMNKGKNSE